MPPIQETGTQFTKGLIGVILEGVQAFCQAGE